MRDRVLALNRDGEITECRAKEMGNGRCNHLLHQKENQSTRDFIKEANKEIGDCAKTVRKPFNKNMTLEEKEALSGKFENCSFVEEEKIPYYAKLIKSAGDTNHNFFSRKERTEKVKEYEKDFNGKIQDMFIVDRGHDAGKELHVVKNNGIVEAYNVNKLENGYPSFITRMIARPHQITRYYKWCDCFTPKYLKEIAKENEDNNRNNW